MYVIDAGYAVIYDKSRNHISISLPQTEETLVDTAEPVVKRKTDLTREELALLLDLARYICERGQKR